MFKNGIIFIKGIAASACIASMLILAGCDKQGGLDIKKESRDGFLVDKISYYVSDSDYKLTEYFYDEDNKLIKILTTGKMVENDQVRDVKYESVFEYKNGLVSKIHVKDQTHFQFSYEVRLFYSPERKIIRNEKWINGTMMGHFNFHYEKNRMVSIYSDTTKPFETNTIVYDNHGNAIKHTYIVPKMSDFGQPIPGEFQKVEHVYEYDNNPTPNFGIDYLFVWQALQGTGTETGFARELSANNLTKYVNSGTTWTFTYNEIGLPIQYEMKWGYIETLHPMKWEITYKEIK